MKNLRIKSGFSHIPLCMSCIQLESRQQLIKNTIPFRRKGVLLQDSGSSRETGVISNYIADEKTQETCSFWAWEKESLGIIPKVSRSQEKKRKEKVRRARLALAFCV